MTETIAELGRYWPISGREFVMIQSVVATGAGRMPGMSRRERAAERGIDLLVDAADL